MLVRLASTVCNAATFTIIFLLSQANLFGQVAIRIPDRPYLVRELYEAGGDLWMSTYDGAYRIRGNVATRIPDKKIDINGVTDVRGAVWIATSDGAYRIDGDRPTRIPDIPLSVSAVNVVLGKVWLATQKGAYRIDGDKSERIPNEDTPVYQVTEAEGKVWLATAKGAFRIDGDKATRVSQPDLYVYQVVAAGGKVWLATPHGAYRIDGDKSVRIPDVDMSVPLIREAGGHAWLVVTSDGAYRIDGNEAVRFPEGKCRSRDVTEAGGKVWIECQYEGLFRVDGDSATLILNNVGWPHITEAAGKLWVQTMTGAYTLNGNTPAKMLDNSYVTKIIDSGGKAWLAAASGAYRVDGDKVTRIPDRKMTVHNVREFQGKVWYSTDEGIYRVDEGVHLSPTLESSGSWWETLVNDVLPGNIWISGDVSARGNYKGSDGKDPYDSAVQRQFWVIMDTNMNHFHEMLNQKEDQYGPERSVKLHLPTGPHTVYLSVRDRWGNKFTDSSGMKGWAVPSSEVIAPILTLFWILVLAILIGFAPVSITCHDLLMNPFMRTYLSFGLVPLSLTVFPMIRRHFLKRYLAAISVDKDFTVAQQQFVIPANNFSPPTFGKLLEDQRLIMVRGESGIGKTFFLRYLTIYYASRIKRRLRPLHTVPVFLPLARFKGKDPGEMFYAALAKYGRITDEKLVEWFLKQGGFIIFVDGLNEVSEESRNKLNAFIDTNHKANYFCISSQARYQEFSWIKEIGLPTLSRNEVKQLLANRLGEKSALSIVEKLGDEAFALYAVPQNLAFAIDQFEIELSMRAGHSEVRLPETKVELYNAILMGLIKSWVASGRGDYAQLLFRKAYETLCAHEPFLSDAASPLPEELLNPLIRAKFAIRREDNFQFSHDMIRSFLASKFLAPRWRTELARHNVQPDENWHTMFEFIVLDLKNDNEIRDLFFILVKKNSRLAGGLFNSIHATHPELCAKWSSGFQEEFGKMSLANMTV